jgi:hypothetical protein
VLLPAGGDEGHARRFTLADALPGLAVRPRALAPRHTAAMRNAGSRRDRPRPRPTVALNVGGSDEDAYPAQHPTDHATVRRIGLPCPLPACSLGLAHSPWRSLDQRGSCSMSWTAFGSLSPASDCRRPTSAGPDHLGRDGDRDIGTGADGGGCIGEQLDRDPRLQPALLSLDPPIDLSGRGWVAELVRAGLGRS